MKGTASATLARIALQPFLHLLNRQRRKELKHGADVDLSPRVGLAPASQTITISRKDTYEAGVKDLPGLPIGISFRVDYALMESMVLSFGEGTDVQYIPTGYLSRLYEALDGRDQDIDPDDPVDIDDEWIVHRILLASTFEISSNSTKEFKTEIEAEFKKKNAEAGGKVVLERTSKKAIKASIKDGPVYLVALSVIDWGDLK